MTRQQQPAAAPPSRDEIRAAIDRSWHDRPGGYGLAPAGILSDALNGMARIDGPYDVEDLRQSELDDLDRLASEALDPIRDALYSGLAEALVEAGAAFARLHPDAPRAKSALERPETAGDPLAAAGSQSARKRAVAAQRPPREAVDVVLDALEAQWEGEFDPGGPDTPAGALESVISRVADPFVDSAARTLSIGGASEWEPLQSDVGPEALWTDLRPSQAAELMELVRDAVERAADRARAVIEQELLEVGKEFTRRYPDALRADPGRV